MFSDVNANGNISTTKAGISGNAATTITTANDLYYAIGGKAYKKAAAAGQAVNGLTDLNTGAAFTAIAPGQAGVFVFCYDSGGNLKIAQGGTVTLDVAGNIPADKYPTFPALPDTVTEFAYLLLKVAAAGANWTMGVTNMSGVANVTYTFDDVMFLPFRPQNA